LTRLLSGLSSTARAQIIVLTFMFIDALCGCAVKVWKRPDRTGSTRLTCGARQRIV